MQKKFSWEDYSILFIALAIGILIIAPAVNFRYFDSRYQGIDFFGSDNENFYLSQIQEVYDGHWSLGNIYLAEGKDDPYVQPPLPAMIVAFLGKLLNVTARDINLITKFLFPFLLTILVYLFFSNVFGRKDLALLMTAFVLLVQATWAFLNPTAWAGILFRGEFIGTNANFLSYSRPINPQVSSFFFFGYLLFIWKFLFSAKSAKSEKLWGIISAIILGLSFYTYFFAFSFLSVFNAMLFFWFWYSKEWKQFKKIIIISIGSLIIAIPYFINLIGMWESSFYLQLTHRLGFADGHKFIFSRVWWGVTAIFLLFYRGSREAKIFILTFLAAAFFVTNQQLITGKTASLPAHYHWYYIAPVGGAILVYLFFVYFEKLVNPFISRLAMIFLMLAFLYGGFLFQKNSYAIQQSFFLSQQRYAPILYWLDENVAKESSIFANDDLSSFIPAYTHHNIYRGQSDSLISEERLKHAIYIHSFLNGITAGKAKDFFYDNRNPIGAEIFGQYYRMKDGCYGCFKDEILNSLILEYKIFLKKDFVAELKKYQIDYIVWDKEKNPEWKIERFFNKKIYEKDNFAIYSSY